MLATSDGQHLREAIKTTLLQLCKVGVSYQNEISIEGTIGVTIDRKNIIFVHFCDKVLTGRPVETPHSITTAVTSHGEVTQSHADSGQDQPDLRLLGAEALSSLHEILNRPHATNSQTSYETEKPTIQEFKVKHLYDPSSSGKFFSFGEGTSISIDSDSDSFASILDENNAETNVLQVKSKAELTFDNEEKTGDHKNIIVIDDNADLFGMHDGQRSSNFSLSGLSDETFGGDSSMPDDESQADIGAPVKDSMSILQTMSDADISDKYSAMCKPTPKVGSSYVRPSPSLSGKYGKGSGKKMSKIRRAAYHHGLAFECEICGQSLTNTGALQSHMITQHDLTETKSLGKISFLKCPHCDKKFRFQAFLDKHLRRHEGIDARPFRCEVCKNAYQYKESLDIHMLVHASIFECPICQKDYNNKLLFQKHIVYLHEVQKKKKKTKTETNTTVTSSEVDNLADIADEASGEG